MSQEIPDAIINLLNKIYSRRFDFENQSKKIDSEKNDYEKKIASCEAKLSLLQNMNKFEYQEKLDDSQKNIDLQE